MTKPVAAFRSLVIGDSRHTVSFNENSHLVLFPSFSRYITSWAISATWPVEASRSRCYRPGSGLEAGSGWSLRPPTAIYRLYLEAHFTYNWGSGICPLDRAVGVNPELSSHQEARLRAWSLELGGAFPFPTAPNSYA
jgi:hypothetical protein